jgi:NADH-quinone oxidoreductase subunit M
MNAAGFPILSLITWLPLLGGLVIMSLGGDEATVASNARWAALWTSLVVFALSLVLWVRFDTSDAGFQFVESTAWLQQGINYKMGVDGISVLFVLLSTLLTPICILSAWEVIHTRVREFMLAFLILETMLVGMFCALDFVVFYIFFEGVLVPMYLIIGIWGGPRRVYAAIKFFLYTLTGSVLMLLALLAMFYQAGTTDIPTLLQTPFPASMQTWLFLALLASFSIKVPMWPVHTWLPDAHVEAPTAGSVVLAGVLLKMGGYGLLRFSLPMLPLASARFAPLMFTLSVIAVIYTSAVALAQTDMKKLVAYSSIAHMGLVTLGLFTFNQQGLDGAMFQMLSHGIVSAALFLCVGVLYDRMHTHEIAQFGGLANRMPRYAFFFMAFTMAGMGLPATSGFVGEFLVLVGALHVNFWLALFGSMGMVLGVAYSLYLYRWIMFGKLTKATLSAIQDLSPREVALFAPLIVITLWMGIYPSSFSGFWAATAAAMISHHQAALHAPTFLAAVTPG